MAGRTSDAGAVDGLREVLGAEPPAGVATLPAADLDRLAGLIAEARERQAGQLERAFEATVKHVPFPLRGVARKMLFS